MHDTTSAVETRRELISGIGVDFKAWHRHIAETEKNGALNSLKIARKTFSISAEPAVVTSSPSQSQTLFRG